MNPPNLREREYLLTFEAGAREAQFQPIAPFRAFMVRLGRRVKPQHVSTDYYAPPSGPWVLESDVVDVSVADVCIGKEPLTVPVPGGFPVDALLGVGISFPAQQVGSVFRVRLAAPAAKAFTLTVCGKEVA